MEMNLGYANKTDRPPIRFWPAYLCFLVFGLLIPFSKPEYGAVTFLLSILLALAMGLLAVNVLIGVFNSSNKALLAESGSQFAKEAVQTGMLFMIPFIVLAALAQLLLGWNAVMPFASAAIMTACATAGTEVMKKGAQGVKNIMIPSAIAFLLSTSWMILVGIMP